MTGWELGGLRELRKDGYRMLEILTEYVIAFFDTHLMGETSSLLDGSSTAYPEVKFHKKP